MFLPPNFDLSNLDSNNSLRFGDNNANPISSELPPSIRVSSSIREQPFAPPQSIHPTDREWDTRCLGRHNQPFTSHDIRSSNPISTPNFRPLNLGSKQHLLGSSATDDALLTRSRSSSLDEPPAGDRVDALTGFIVADAHFGEDNPNQPAPQEVRQMINHVHRRFPDLDVFMDAGDAYHKADDESQRGDWLTYLAGASPQIPFYYVAGNHEAVNFSHESNPEDAVIQTGSLSARPYYSFDLKNVHIVSLPQLMHANYHSAEELAWLKLDLELNQDKTVILVSHNALPDTTAHQTSPVYRQVANSEAIFDLMRQYSNIRAWIHGHNHVYDVVQKDGNLFVSAGRIGGFMPGGQNSPWGSQHLGGIYFEVQQDSLTVRAYSASEKRFMDRLGYPHLSQTLRFDTSLDSDAPASLSYGYGLARDGQRIVAYNHHLNPTQRELFVSGSSGPIFSDNPQFQSFSEDDKHGKTLNAIRISPNHSYEWLDPNIRLLPREPGETTKVDLPSPNQAQRAYYRIAPDRHYTAALDLDALGQGQQATLEAKVHDSEGNLVATLPSESWTLTGDPQTLRYQFYVPTLSTYPSIYTDSTLDRQFQLSVQARFANMHRAVTLEEFSLQLTDATGSTSNPNLIIDGVNYAHTGTLGPDEYDRFNLPIRSNPRSVFEAHAEGSGLLTFLVRETGLQWQVRNAVASQSGDTLVIGPMRNNFAKQPEILITPMGDRARPYLNRLRNIDQARVTYTEAGLAVEIVEAYGPQGMLTVVADTPPQQVQGAKRWSFKNGLLKIIAPAGTLVNVKF